MGQTWRLELEPVQHGYADAQIDDYGGRKRSDYLWRPGSRVALRARFSHGANQLVGTAGFGFWNAPFGDPTVRFPAMPQVTWFFYASQPSDLPFPVQGVGRGWFAGTLDASMAVALVLAPLAIPIVIANNVNWLRRRIWPIVRRQLGVSHAAIPVAMDEWHDYALSWQEDGCHFLVDGAPVHQTTYCPGGPLGFVCWIDNQYMVATPGGRFRWGTLPCPEVQWLEVQDFRLEHEGGHF
jgi:hypothetical protein